MPGIGAIQLQAWRSSYASLLPDGLLARLDAHTLERAWRPAVTDPPSPAHAVLVAVADDVVVGFAACDGSGEIVALAVDPLHQRQGHGSRLLAALADHGRATGLPSLGTWCLMNDEPRRDFFSSAGFGPDGGLRLLTLDDADLPTDPATDADLTTDAEAVGQTRRERAGLREAHLVTTLSQATT